MAVKSTIKNMVLCLTTTCTICAAILGAVYAVTFEPIQNTNLKILKSSLEKVLPKGGEMSSEQTINVEGNTYQYYTTTINGKVAAYAIKSETIGFGGPLVLMVGILEDGTIYNTTVLVQNETPGLGAKCATDIKFIDQFKGLNPEVKKLSVTKDGGDIDAITASTITSRAYALAVENAVKAFNAITK